MGSVFFFLEKKMCLFTNLSLPRSVSVHADDCASILQTVSQFTDSPHKVKCLFVIITPNRTEAGRASTETAHHVRGAAGMGVVRKAIKDHITNYIFSQCKFYVYLKV